MNKIDQILQEFDEVFLSKDSLSSVGQFNSDVSGRLPGAFRDFLLKSINAVLVDLTNRLPDDNSIPHYGCYKAIESYARSIETLQEALHPRREEAY